MNQFLVNAIEESGKTKADIARAIGITPQAVNSAVNTSAPRPDTIIQVLYACGWDVERVKALRLVDVYQTAVNGES